MPDTRHFDWSQTNISVGQYCSPILAYEEHGGIGTYCWLISNKKLQLRNTNNITCLMSFRNSVSQLLHSRALTSFFFSFYISHSLHLFIREVKVSNEPKRHFILIVAYLCILDHVPDVCPPVVILCNIMVKPNIIFPHVDNNVHN